MVDSPSWPVSVKGVVCWGDRFVVLRNERDEWELPGGRLELSDADPPDALAREVLEELDIEAIVGELIDTWIYDVAGKRVLMLTYLCEAAEPRVLSHSGEHTAVAAKTLAELRTTSMPEGYLRSLGLAEAATRNRQA